MTGPQVHAPSWLHLLILVVLESSEYAAFTQALGPPLMLLFILGIGFLLFSQ